MKSLVRALWVWLVLGGLSYCIATGGKGDFAGPGGVGVLLIALLVAAWLTAISAVDDDASHARGIVLTITTLAWAATFIITQGRLEAHPEERTTFLQAFGLAVLIVASVAVKTRSFPRWPTLRAVAITLAVPAGIIGILLGCFELKTAWILRHAKARWREIGLPLEGFENSLTVSRENGGSEGLRKVLREEIGSHYYKDTTRAAAQEPAIENSKEAEVFVAQALKLLKDYPPSDDIDLSGEKVDLLESAAPSLDAHYEQILAAEPPAWDTDPHDGFGLNAPNFLGVRKFAQVTAADTLRRFSVGDQEGAARALRAGLRVADGMRQNPLLISVMIGVAVDALLSEKQVRLPASADAFPAIARDVENYRAALLGSMRLEAWNLLQFSERLEDTLGWSPEPKKTFLPKWFIRAVTRAKAKRESAVAILDDAEHTAILKAPGTLSQPDLGESLHVAISQAHPSPMECNILRATMRIHATLLLREQTELIRQARARLAKGQPLEGRDSVVLPHVRWELTADAKNTSVTTRLVNAPKWIVENEVTGQGFWVIPLNGSAAWKFHQPAQTTN